MGFVASYQYDDAPHRLDEYVSVDEIDGLLNDEGKAFSKNPKRVLHFLSRVRNTLLAFRQQIQALHRDVQSANIRSTSIGTPTSLDPRSAAKFLPPEEIAALADELIREKLAALRTAEAEVAERRADVLRKANALKFALATIVEDYSIPESVRERVTAAFTAPIENLRDLATSPDPEAQTTPIPVSAQDASLDDLFT